MRKAIVVASITFIVLLFAACRMWSSLADEIGRVSAEAEHSTWTSVEKSQRFAVASISVIGRDWYWHAFVFSGFSVAGAIAHGAAKTTATRVIVTIFVFAVMLLGTAVFVAAEQLSGILTIPQRMEAFGGMLQVKLASVVIALFAGRTFFEIFKTNLK